MKIKLFRNLIGHIMFFYSSLFSEELHQGVYMTSWVAGSQKGTKLLEKVKENNLDAIVIDMKDATGYVVYDSNVDLVEKIGSEEIRIKDKN